MEALHTTVYRIGKRTFDFGARTHLMGVLNVTPDSFSDGGRYLDAERAVAHALEMVEEGADIIDVGGESTRPKGAPYGRGAEPVPLDVELRRVIPVIERLAGCTDAPISVDTYKAAVASAALKAGAAMVNDISGFTFDPAMAEVVGSAGGTAAIMHIKGTPATMQMNPAYTDLFGEIKEHLRRGVELGAHHGITQMFIDPGIGFGKTLQHNLQLIHGLRRLASLGYPILVGPSRKTFIGTILDLPIGERLEGTLAACVACVMNGAHLLRVHDVREALRAVRVADAIARAEIGA